jgi:hypothetical protein
MEDENHFNLLIEMNEFVINQNALFTNSFPIENEYKKGEAAILPEKFLFGFNADRYHDWRSISASA